jgi:hypothetical protein
MARVFAAPLGIAALSGFGFVAAFVFGDAEPWLAWLGIGSPLAVIAWSAMRAASGSARPVELISTGLVRSSTVVIPRGQSVRRARADRHRLCDREHWQL